MALRNWSFGCFTALDVGVSACTSGVSTSWCVNAARTQEDSLGEAMLEAKKSFLRHEGSGKLLSDRIQSKPSARHALDTYGVLCSIFFGPGTGSNSLRLLRTCVNTRRDESCHWLLHVTDLAGPYTTVLLPVSESTRQNAHVDRLSRSRCSTDICSWCFSGKLSCSSHRARGVS